MNIYDIHEIFMSISNKRMIYVHFLPVIISRQYHKNLLLYSACVSPQKLNIFIKLGHGHHK
jgi:hypothetical protein